MDGYWVGVEKIKQHVAEHEWPDDYGTMMAWVEDLLTHIATIVHTARQLRDVLIAHRAAAADISCRLADEWQGENLDESCLADLSAFSKSDKAMAAVLASPNVQALGTE